MEGLVSSTGGGRLPAVASVRFIQRGGEGSVPSPVFVFYVEQGGMALSRPLYSAIYGRGERFSTVPCVLLCIAQRGTALYRPLG